MWGRGYNKKEKSEKEYQVKPKILLLLFQKLI